MKNLFVFIALSIGLSVLLALGALTASLFIESVLIIILYALSGVSFAVAATLTVAGYLRLKKKK